MMVLRRSEGKGGGYVQGKYIKHNSFTLEVFMGADDVQLQYGPIVNFRNPTAKYLGF